MGDVGSKTLSRTSRTPPGSGHGVAFVSFRSVFRRRLAAAGGEATMGDTREARTPSDAPPIRSSPGIAPCPPRRRVRTAPGCGAAPAQGHLPAEDLVRLIAGESRSSGVPGERTTSCAQRTSGVRSTAGFEPELLLRSRLREYWQRVIRLGQVDKWARRKYGGDFLAGWDVVSSSAAWLSKWDESGHWEERVSRV